MKHARKLAGILLAMVMALALALPAFAAETTITAPAGSTRTYDVYQIFTGTLSGNVLSDVKWGKNGTGTVGEAVPEGTLKALTAVNSVQSDTDKLDVIKNYVNLNSEKFGTVSDGSPLNAPTGYYLIKDNGPVGDGEAYSLYVVQVVGPTTISPKVSTVTSEKKVDDKNDSNNTQDATVWEDSADYDIGDDVPFQLKATIAQDYDNYKVYKLTFHDQESAGLTFKPETVVVKIDGSIVDASKYTVTTSTTEAPLSDGDTFEVSFADLKSTAAKAGSVITVEYSSTLNDQAVLGSTGNPNTMHVTYSNNPNDDQGGENGKTPEDTVIVFTYKVVANKVTKNSAYDASKDPEKTGTDSEGHKEFIPLEGAGFTLYKKNASGEYVAVGSEVKGNEMTTFEWKGLDDGDYKIVETTTPAGYNTIADIEFTITATHDTESADPKLTELKGGNKFTGEVDTGVITTNIQNNKGSTLPETGGIGTTIFYVVGSILVLAAVVLLITKKRMSEDK